MTTTPSASFRYPPTPDEILNILIAHDKAPAGATVRDVARVAGTDYHRTADVMLLDVKGMTYKDLYRHYGWDARLS